LTILTLTLSQPQVTDATVSDQFFARNGEVIDHWGIIRTNSLGENGFLRIRFANPPQHQQSFTSITGFTPIIVNESLGKNTDLAWELGLNFRKKYPDRYQRAEKIFQFVRDNVVYTSDSDQFGRNEFAQNADELALNILKEKSGKGDCEDSAILLAVMYKASGYRSALVLTPGHVATLVYLPDYKKATRKMSLGKEYGWVWAEATGYNNRFGWIPESVLGTRMIANEVTTDNTQIKTRPTLEATTKEDKPYVREDKSILRGGISLIAIMGSLWIIGRKKQKKIG
jgi:transglutaminase-like putative cysteine protease